MKYLKTDLLQTIENIENTSVLVCGDIILDTFYYGSVDRISPESPVPVLTQKRSEHMPGGAGNTYANLQSLKTQSRLISVCGDDENADILRDADESNGLHLVPDTTRPTSVKTRFLAGHHHLLRSDYEQTHSIEADVEKNVLNLLHTHIPAHGAFILSDYGKGVLTQSIIDSVLTECANHDVPVIVDPKGTDFTKYAGAYAITPNKNELALASGMPTDTDAQVERAGQYIIDTCDIQVVIATRSAQGISIIQKGHDPVHIPTLQREVYDVSGAGDTVIAMIAVALATGTDVYQASMLANIAGGIVVSKVGTALIRKDDLIDVLQEPDIMLAMGIESDQTGKNNQSHVTLDLIKEDIARWRAKGLKVGFTNGCFDILHQGHVSYLNNARQHCDRLIVGLNSDSSVRILKGETRPVHDETGRAVVLQGLQAVDRVILFGAEQPGDDNTAIALINMIKPDVYFKGGDYVVDDIPETPAVRAYGGEVRVLNEVKGQSTTNSLKKMQLSA